MSTNGPSGRGVKSASQLPESTRSDPAWASQNDRISTVLTDSGPASDQDRPAAPVGDDGRERLLEGREVLRAFQQLLAVGHSSP